MPNDTDATEKIKDFVNEVILFAKNKNSRFTAPEELVQQALVILTIEGLCIENNTLESIKHLLDDSQIEDINKIIKQNNAMKTKLYDNVRPT